MEGAGARATLPAGPASLPTPLLDAELLRRADNCGACRSVAVPKVGQDAGLQLALAPCDNVHVTVSSGAAGCCLWRRAAAIQPSPSVVPTCFSQAQALRHLLQLRNPEGQHLVPHLGGHRAAAGLVHGARGAQAAGGSCGPRRGPSAVNLELGANT